MSHKPHNIEELLETMGSKEFSADPEHRYELRRNLLCSRFFDDENTKASGAWDRVMTYTAPLMAGGMIVGVFALIAFYAPIEPDIGPQTSVHTIVLEDEKVLAEVVPLNVEDFISDPNEPKVSLADFVSKKKTVLYTPIDSRQYIRTQ